MSKRERLQAALARRSVDRPQVACWRHVSEVDHNLGRPHRSHARLPAQMGPRPHQDHVERGQGALGRELEALRLILAGRSDDVPVLHTVFAPLSIARKLAGDRLLGDLKDHPDAVMAALDTITETVIRYVAAVAQVGADGIFYASQDASRDVLEGGEHARFSVPYSWRVLESLNGSTLFTMLHAHAEQISFDRKATLPVAAMNLHVRLTAPSLSDALKRFSGAVAGGFDESETLLKGPVWAVAAQVAEAIQQTGGIGVIIPPRAAWSTAKTWLAPWSKTRRGSSCSSRGTSPRAATA